MATSASATAASGTSGERRVGSAEPSAESATGDRTTSAMNSRHRQCLGGALAFTTPGSRVVRVCGDELMRPSRHRDDIVAMVIHETLHTLGLPENPPSSVEITRRVLARCGTTR